MRLQESWQRQWQSWLAEEEKIEVQKSGATLAALQLELKALDEKASLLLEGYLNGTIEQETYKHKKNEIFDQKQKVQEEIVLVARKGSSWIEPFRDFVKTASQLEKIARAKNNCEDLRIFARKVGSNLLLQDRKLTPNFTEAFQALRAGGGARSALTNPDPFSHCADSTGIEPAVCPMSHRTVLTAFCGVYWTKFECISDKIRRILTNDTCASAALDKLARSKTQKFPIIFICGSPHTPRREAEHLKGRKFLGFAAAASLLQKGL